MRFSTRNRLGAVATIALLAGCSGYQPSAAPSQALQSQQAQSAAAYRPMVAPDGSRSLLPQGFQADTSRSPSSAVRACSGFS